jgi:pyrroloquinoline quinone (PQQ) biosynthesis protein C
MSFFEQLQEQTAGERTALQAVPVIRQALAGQVSRPLYVAFLAEAFHHVKHTLPLLMACGSRLPQSHEWLREAMAHYIDEEIGHHEWILKDIEACGADANAVRHGKPHAATELMVAYAYDTITRGNPVGFLGMVHVLEGTSASLATHAAQVLQSSLDLPSRAFVYLTSHGSVDVDHVDFFAGVVNRLDNDEDRHAVIHGARMFYHLYSEIFRALPSGVAA